MILCIRLSSLVTSSQWKLSPRSPQGHMTLPSFSLAHSLISPFTIASFALPLSLSLSLSITPTRTLCLTYDITWSRDNGGQRDKWLSPRGVGGSLCAEHIVQSFFLSRLCTNNFLKRGKNQFSVSGWPCVHGLIYTKDLITITNPAHRRFVLMFHLNRHHFKHVSGGTWRWNNRDQEKIKQMSE